LREIPRAFNLFLQAILIFSIKFTHLKKLPIF
jgi:hypothetical protein